MQIPLPPRFTTTLIGMAKKVGEDVKNIGKDVKTAVSSRICDGKVIGFCATTTIALLIARIQMDQSKEADKENELKHDKTCREVKKTIRESERRVIVVIKNEAAQPTKYLEEMMKIQDKQYSSSSWFWTDKRVNHLEAKLDSFQKEAEVKEKTYLDTIEGLANLLLDDGSMLDEKKARVEEVLQSLGMEQLTPEIGEEFDEARHVVIHQIPDLKRPPGIILQIIENGYICNGRVLRRAQVGVSRTVEARTPKS